MSPGLYAISFSAHHCSKGQMHLFACHRYPHVFTLHCTAHALDLALERIGELEFFKSAIDRAKKVVQLITNSHAPHAIFKGKSELRLLKPGECRMGSCCLLRLYARMSCQALPTHILTCVLTCFQVTPDSTPPTYPVPGC